MALFGGVRKHSMDQNKVPVRGDIHVIIVGMHRFLSQLSSILLNLQSMQGVMTFLYA